MLDLLVTLAGIAFAIVVLRWVTRAYLAFRGTRVVTCPETQIPAAVEVDARHAAVTSVLARPELRLRSCTRWPERMDCGQECLAEIESAPLDCLARTMLLRFYAGRSCVVCHSPFGDIEWHDHKPALMTADGETVTWEEVRPERLPDVLATHGPVCWNCHIGLRFRRRHPELVTDCRWPHT